MIPHGPVTKNQNLVGAGVPSDGRITLEKQRCHDPHGQVVPLQT